MPPTLALSVLLLAAMAGHSSGTWCVCKDGVGDTALQKALDYACGAGADCNPIRQNAACFLPNTVRAHCSYAVNSYFQKKGQTQGSCDFGGVATISTTDPSASGCSYPSTAGCYSSGGGGSTPVTMTPTPPGTTTVPGMTSPVARSPPTTTTTNPLPNTASPTGVLGGAGTGVSPTGAGTTTTDESDGGFRLQRHIFFSFSTVFLFSFMVWWD